MENTGVIYSPKIIRDTATRIPRKRIWELDFLRGICIILMVFDHTIFNFRATFGAAWIATGNPGLISLVEFGGWYWTHPARESVQELVLWAFFALCGMSVIFSRNNYLHSIKILIVAAIITAATSLLVSMNVMDKGFYIRFGVLHMLGVSSLIVSIIYSLTRKNKWVSVYTFLGLALFLALLDLLYLNQGRWYKDIPWLCIFHPNMGDIGKFSPGDCFPLIPYITRVFTGAAIAQLVYKEKRSLLPKFDGNWQRPINYVGRKTLWIVLLHQPVIVAAIAIITYLFLTPGDFVIV